MGLLALAVVPLLILEARATDPIVRSFAVRVNWGIWLAFCAEFLVKFVLARYRLRFIRNAWFDIAIIALSPPFFVPHELDGIRALRALRLLRLLRVVRLLALAAIGLRLTHRLLQHRRLGQVILVAAVIVGVGALAVYHLEQGVNPAVGTLGDAVWWAIVTATTVGYGDVSPVTGEGRAVAVLLMLVGIAVIGVFTATVSSFFFEQQREDEHARMDERLKAIEDKLDQVLERSMRET
jgi:voltage-gated potassium channel